MEEFCNGSAIASTSTIYDVIETAVRETLTCVSCSSPLINLADALIWESLEFCSEKCLSMYTSVSWKRKSPRNPLRIPKDPKEFIKSFKRIDLEEDSLQFLVMLLGLLIGPWDILGGCRRIKKSD